MAIGPDGRDREGEVWECIENGGVETKVRPVMWKHELSNHRGVMNRPGFAGGSNS